MSIRTFGAVSALVLFLYPQASAEQAASGWTVGLGGGWAQLPLHDDSIYTEGPDLGVSANVAVAYERRLTDYLSGEIELWMDAASGDGPDNEDEVLGTQKLLLNLLADRHIGQRWRVYAAPGLGIARNNIDFGGDNSRVTFAWQFKTGAQMKIARQSWLGIEGRTGFVNDIKGSEFRTYPEYENGQLVRETTVESDYHFTFVNVVGLVTLRSTF